MGKIDFIKATFLIASTLILFLGFTIPNVNITVSIIVAVVIGLLVLMDKHALDIVKLSEDNPKVETFRFLNRVTIFMVIACYLFTIFTTLEGITISKNNTFIIGLISIFMMIFGNLSPKIPFNRYLGLRLPWTIRDEQTWRIAHRFLGFLSFPIALIMFILSFFFNINTIGAIGILTWIAIPSIYSFIFYYKKMK